MSLKYVIAGAGMAAALAAGNAVASEVPADPVNPLLVPWTGPYGGVPPFDRARVGELKPALETAMADQLAEVERIASNPVPANFENTIAAMERAGRALDRSQTVFGIYTATLNDDAVQAVEREMEPRLAAHRDRITQNEALFRRIAAVYEGREDSGLTPEQQRLAWLYYTNFVRAGAKLDPESKRQLSEINVALAGLYTRFSQNVLADENDQQLVIENEADLAGLPESVRSGAAEVAEARGQKGKWVIANTRSSIEPFLTYSERRNLREQAWRMFVNRGDNGGSTDNNAIITEILRLRAKRAKLLGYETHAHWRLENAMAKEPARAIRLMEEVWTPAVARVHEEVADMQAIADKEGAGIRIAPWDYRYYAEKVRKAKYDLDETEVTPYLQLENLREGMFYMARELFGFHFRPVDPAKVPVYHPDVRVWEVTDPKGQLVGLWFFDPYARKGKHSGAWMDAYRVQERFDGDVKTIVSNNSNFVKGKAGEPVLISWTDARTLFHEFGHALHGLSSNVNYPLVSGTRVARDYVEFPSQVLEHWLSTPEILDRYALHYQTGKPIPKELVAKIRNSDTFNQGFDTVEYLSSALIDMKLHLAGEQAIDPDRFERETLAAMNMPSEIVMRHRTPQFMHVFGSDGYSAGYYSYLWSDTLTADAWEAFTEAGGPWDKAMAQRLRDHVFSVGNTIDPAEGYRAFRGRDAQIAPLMRKRGFPVPAPAEPAAAGSK
jgi:peptidyl-dipeptidase Dcp